MLSTLLLAAGTGNIVGVLVLIFVILALVLFGIATFWRVAPAASWSRLVSGGLFALSIALLTYLIGGGSAG